MVSISFVYKMSMEIVGMKSVGKVLDKHGASNNLLKDLENKNSLVCQNILRLSSTNFVDLLLMIDGSLRKKRYENENCNLNGHKMTLHYFTWQLAILSRL